LVEEKVTSISLLLHPGSAFTIEMATIRLIHLLKDCEERSIPQAKPSKSGMKPKPPDVSAAIKISKAKFSTWKSAGKPEKGNQAHTDMVKAKRNLRSLERQHAATARLNLYQDIMDSHDGDIKLFHRLIGRQRSGPNSKSTSTIEYDNITYKDDQVLQGFGRYFGDLATPSDNPAFDSVHSSLVDSDMVILDHLADLCHAKGTYICKVTVKEIAQGMAKLNKGKAADIFGLTTEHLIYAKDSLAPILSALFSLILQAGFIPSTFQEGLVLPLLKKPNKDKKQPTNYRGITIISVVGKLLEVIILLRIKEHFKLAQSPLQRGFTQEVSPLFAAFILCEVINEQRDSKGALLIALLDAEKAFDRVSHPVLFRKLALLGIPVEFWRILRDWYSNFRSSVCWNGTSSLPFSIQQGTLQGSILSPDLYKMYNNDTLKELQKHHLGATIGTECCVAPTCADDVALLATNARDMQLLLGVVENHASMDKLTINASKTALLSYKSGSREGISTQDLVLNDKNLEVQDCAVHLGLKQGTIKNINIKRVDEAILMGTRSMYALFGAGLHGRNGLNPAVSRKLWLTFILPRMLHGAELWQLKTTHLEKLDQFQRCKIREVQGFPLRTAIPAVLGLLGVLPISAVIHRQALTLLRNMVADKESLEYNVCLRQVAMKAPSSQSWLVYINSILDLYQLPNVSSIVLNTPSKPEWKRTVSQAILSHWNEHIVELASERETVKYISKKSLDLGKPALVWDSCASSHRDTMKAFIKARFMTDTYKLRYHEAKFGSKANQNHIDSTCSFCNGAPETTMHHLMLCPTFNNTRSAYMSNLASTLKDLNISPLILHDVATALQITLDCSHESLPCRISDNLLACCRLEKLARDFLFCMHTNRCRLLSA
jgi:hypothetical protein